MKKDSPGAEFYVFHNDTDGDEAHAQQIRAARDALAHGAVCVVATPHPETEAWLCCAFEAKTKEDQLRLENEKKRLGFDPVTMSHQLTAKRKTDKKDAKRVYKALYPNPNDETMALSVALDILRARGAGNYLAAFLDEVQERFQ